MNNETIILTLFAFISIVLVIVLIVIARMKKVKRYKAILEELEVKKNQTIAPSILKELSRAEEFVKNEKIEQTFNLWKSEFNLIKNEKIPYVTDLLLESDILLDERNYSELKNTIVKTELEVYKVSGYVSLLLSHVRELTTSEEKNRQLVTEYKAEYRKLLREFSENRKKYGELERTIELQFENIEKRFQTFEENIEQGNFDDIAAVVKSIETMTGHMKVILDEAPIILFLGNNAIPKKVIELKKTHTTMTRDGYILDYMNIEYNIEETSKKISDIFDRAKTLNFEDSLLTLKTISEYYDTLFVEMEKEKKAKSDFLINKPLLISKVNKINGIMENILKYLDETISNYDTNEINKEEILKAQDELIELNNSATIIVDDSKPKSFAYSRLNKELELLILKEAKLEVLINSIFVQLSSMRDNEQRAREQLIEIRDIIKQAKYRTRDYKLPALTNSYYVELEEAEEAIAEIIKELDRKPIVISDLNTRVDTARDLAFKLYNTTDELIKTVMLLETAITYGNKYRSLYVDVHKSLNRATHLFFKGEYKKALEITINTLDSIEPGIYDRLLEYTNRFE